MLCKLDFAAHGFIQTASADLPGMWVRAMDIYGRVSREIEPKKARNVTSIA